MINSISGSGDDRDPGPTNVKLFALSSAALTGSNIDTPDHTVSAAMVAGVDPSAAAVRAILRKILPLYTTTCSSPEPRVGRELQAFARARAENQTRA